VRGEERELKEIVGVIDSGTGPTPEPRPAFYNKGGVWAIPIFSNILDGPLPSRNLRCGSF